MPPKRNLSSNNKKKKKMRKDLKKKGNAAVKKLVVRKTNTAPPKSSDNKEEEEPMWGIGKSYFVKVNEFWGNSVIDIRCYYYKNGNRCPSKTGITLNKMQWRKFLDSMKEIDAALKAKCAKKKTS